MELEELKLLERMEEAGADGGGHRKFLAWPVQKAGSIGENRPVVSLRVGRWCLRGQSRAAVRLKGGRRCR